MPRIEGDSGVDTCRTEDSGPRRVYVYTPALDAETQWSGNYYDGSREPVQIVVADARGRYQVEVPPGEYSLLVDDDDRKYCHRRYDEEVEGRTRSCPVNVESQNRHRFDFVIDHASY